MVRPGLPGIPFVLATFGLPPDGEIRARIIDVRDEGVDAVLTPFGDADTPLQSETQWIETTPITMRDGLRIGSVRVMPVRLLESRLRYARSMTIDIRIIGETEAVAAFPGEIPTHLVNVADAAAWKREIPRPVLARRPAMANEPRLRVRTLDAGVYRITARDFDNAGVSRANVDPRSIRLTHNGVERPIIVTGQDDGVFDEHDVIEFYAERKQGEFGEYFDEWDDRNTFFLAWGASDGLRMVTENAAPSQWPSARPVSSIPARLHLEEDHEYHRGDKEYDDMQMTIRVPGETWIWSYLLKKDSLRIPFELSQPIGDAAKLQFRVKGSSRDTSLLRISLNDVILFENDIPSYDTLRTFVNVPAGLLRDGENTLVFLSVGRVHCPPENPICSIERIYVDWAELLYSRAVLPIGGELLLDASAASIPTTDRLLLRLPQEMRAFNIDAGAVLEGITQDNADFLITVAGDQHYHFFTEARQPLSVTLVQPTEYSAPERQADYIVVTHSLFRAQAERLARYRESTDGYSTVIADVEQLYDEFNHGHKHPSAIRDFLRTAWEYWREPRPRFVLLMGDASWDAKQRKAISTKVDFVPAFGNPVSDNYYVRFSEVSTDPTPYLAIGRIPAETPADADAVIDKILEFESLPPQVQDNRFLFSVGGQSEFEQALLLKPYEESLVLNYVLPNCGDAIRIHKRTMTMISYDDLDTLIHEVNRGITWFFFLGHGGTRVIDVGVERPDIFTNPGKYFFFSTFSCNTAHFAEPFETGLNERFLMSPRNGAVVTFGQAGLGVLSKDYQVYRGMHRAIMNDGLRNYGEVILHGKKELIASTGSGEQQTINAVDQLVLLGDPATRMPLARTPELLVLPTEITTEPEILTEQQNTRIRAIVRNVGVCMPDSMDVTLSITKNGNEVFESTTRVGPFSVLLPMEWEYDFTGIDGEVNIIVTVDSGDELEEQDETNNIATISKHVQPRGIAALFPLDFAVLPSGEMVDFIVANPSFIPEEGDPRVELQISSHPDFSTILLEERQAAGAVFTKFALQASSPPDAVLFWRARMIGGMDDSWSSPRSFRVSPSTTGDDYWHQEGKEQLRLLESSGLHMDDVGVIRLGTRELNLEIASGGFSGPFRQAILRVGDEDVSPNERGFNCAVVEPTYGDVVATANFDTYKSSEIALEMLDFVRAVADDHILMLAVLDDANGYPPVSPNGSNILPELKAELYRFGAWLIDSVGFRDSYGFIGSKVAPDRAKEMHFVLGTVLFRDTVIVRSREGYFATPRFAPTNMLRSLRWDGVAVGDGAELGLRVIGYSPTGSEIVHADIVNAPPNTTIDLGNLVTETAPFIRIEGTLRSPVIEKEVGVGALQAEYTSRYPEFGVTSRVVRSVSDSVLEGESMVVDVEIHNAGRVAGNVSHAVIRSSTGDRVVGAPSAMIEPGASWAHRFSFSTAGMRGLQSYDVVVDTSSEFVEYYRANNVYARSFIVGRDGRPPTLDVLFDGVPIVKNDYVSSRPEILVVLRDLSPLPVTDTSAVQMFLNGHRVWLMSDPAVEYTTGAGEEKVRVLYTPELRDGMHVLAVSGKDASGNAADSIPYQVRFYVSSEARIDQILPYPSPTTGPMEFTFRCTGSEAPGSARITIYTVAGRPIRRIDVDEMDLRVGFNRIYWDGRDEDGDRIANGVYFYKLSVRQQGRSNEYVGRFSVLR